VKAQLVGSCGGRGAAIISIFILLGYCKTITEYNKGKKMNNEFFIRELAKEFCISENNTKRLLNKVAKTIKREKQVTKNLLARIIVHNLKKIKKEEESINKQKVLSNFKHKCLQKHYYKFLELYKQGWGGKRIENYFKNTLRCSISKAYLDKVLKFLREGGNG
jgi:hypothetical protein